MKNKCLLSIFASLALLNMATNIFSMYDFAAQEENQLDVAAKEENQDVDDFLVDRLDDEDLYVDDDMIYGDEDEMLDEDDLEEDYDISEEDEDLME